MQRNHNNVVQVYIEGRVCIQYTNNNIICRSTYVTSTSKLRSTYADLKRLHGKSRYNLS